MGSEGFNGFSKVASVVAEGEVSGFYARLVALADRPGLSVVSLGVGCAVCIVALGVSGEAVRSGWYFLPLALAALAALAGFGCTYRSAVRNLARQLSKSEAQFRDLTRLSSDWVWETDLRHRLCFLSESAVASLGAWSGDAIGKALWDARLIGLPRADWDGFKADLASARRFDDFRYSLLDPDGHLYSISVSGEPRFDAAGAVAGYRGIGRNVTRATQQQLLLQLESEMAAVIREQEDPQRVVAEVIVAVSRMMGWSGGARLVQIDGTTSITVRERWGLPALMRTLGELPRQIPIVPDSVEAKAWKGHAIWIHDVTLHPAFAERYRLHETRVQAAFLAPITDQHGSVLSALLFFSSQGFRADEFLSQVADILSRTLSLYLQRKAAEKRLVKASLHDALTGLPNRVHLTDLLQRRLADRQPAAVLYVDLDRYKAINDTLGHQAGDQVLVEVARRFREVLGAKDVAGRIGGDEFILLLAREDETVDSRSPPDSGSPGDSSSRDDPGDPGDPGDSDSPGQSSGTGGNPGRGNVEATARKVLAAIERPFILQDRAHFLSASIGVALSPEHGSDATSLVRCADSAMYQVKSEGRNDVRFFASAPAHDGGSPLQLAGDLPSALERGEVDLYYQPVLSLGDKRIVSVEGLLRWRHPTRGLLLPESFLPTTEQGNLMREVGLWAIRRALDDRIELGIDANDDMSVSVNVSPRHLEAEGFLAQVTSLLAERGVPPRLLRLELTENALIHNSKKTVALLRELRRLGIQVVIDNFGTGYASLSYLRNLPVAGLKIDATFVRQVHSDRGNAAIVQAVMTLAGKLGLEVVAEGIETSAEMRALRAMDCHQIQGTFVCEPLPLAHLKDFLQTVPNLRQMHQVGQDRTAEDPVQAQNA